MANRYFVGTGNWDASDTSVWSDSSGGTTGFSVPTATDDVFIDANSTSVTITASALCDDLDFTGFVGTFAGTSTLAISGSLTLATGMTRSYTGAITFNSTATGKTITLNGKTTASSTTFNGTGGGWTVQDTWNNGTSNITLTAGTFNTNGQTITCGTLNASGSTTRTLTLGASTVNLSYWNTQVTTNLTFNANTSTLSFTTANAGNVFNAGGLTFNVVTIAVTGSTSISISGANTFATLTLTGPTNKTQQFSLSANQTVSGTLTIAGNSLTNRLLVRSSTLGTARTITAATTTLSNVDFQDITGAGAGSWSGTSIGNALGNTTISFTTPVTRYAVVAGNWSDTATWSTSSGGGGGASVPLCHDTVILNASSAAGTYTADMPRWGADVTMTGFTRTLTTSAFASYIYGSVTLASGMTLNDVTEEYYIQGRSSHTITTAGKNWGGDTGTKIQSFGGTYTLQDDWTNSSGYFWLDNGTFDANDNDITVTYVSSSSSNTRTVSMGTGTWTVTSTGTIWNFTTATNLTLNAETSTIVISNATTTAKTFAGGSKTYNNLTITGAGVANYTFTGSNTFNTFASTKTVAHGLVFTVGTTQTIATWSVVGTAGNVVTINSTTTGTHTLTKSGGGRITSDYLDIQHSVATPSDTWYAGLNSTDNQATATAGSGWLFTVPLPTATTQAVSGITDVNATANGNVTDDGEGTINERGFVYDTVTRSAPANVAPASSGYASSVIETGTFVEGAFTGSLTGLTESTTYYVRAYCENEAGFDYGDEVNFTTEATPLSPTLTTEAVSSITGTGGTGNGTIVEDNGSTVTERGMAVSTTSHTSPSNTNPDDSDYEFVFSDTGTYTEGAFTKAITGLSNGTLYYVRAYAMNGVGYDYGNEVSFTTLTSPTVTIQTPSNRQSTTVTLNGTITDDGGEACTARGFNYGTATGVYGTTVTENGSFNEGVFDIDVTGLVQNTTYFVRAYATNALGTSYSSEIQFSTNTFPNTTAVTNGTTNSVTIVNKTTTQSSIINQTTNSVTIDNIEL